MKPRRPPSSDQPQREATLQAWLDAVLKDGRKANLVTAGWRKAHRSLPEAVYIEWVREFKRRLHAGGVRAGQPQWPEWLARRLQAAWKDKAHELMAALQLEASLFVRVNTCRVTTEQLAAQLKAEGIETVTMPGACLRLGDASRGRIFRSAAFRDGLCEVQDVHSQQITPLLEVKPGETVIDACAGEGGKTLQLADLMRNKGRLRAYDPQEHKLEQLRRRARRAGYHNIEARPTPQGPQARRLRGTADAVLVDAPCSASGVIRRHPEIKWKLQEADIPELARLQADILERCAFWARPGGRVLFVTCSLFPEEGEQLIAGFLERHADQFRLVSENRWWPAADGGDGFYAALLTRTG